MKKQILLIFMSLISLCIFAQENDNIQPHWGISYTRGQVIAVPPTYRNSAYPPITNFWKYAATEMFYTFYVKNLSFSTGIAIQSNSSSTYTSPKYPGMQSGNTQVPFLGYISLNYHLLPYRRISPYISLGIESRVIDFNTLLGDIGLRIQPSYTLPLWIGVKGRFARAFYSEKARTYSYLDNVGIGLSVQYAFKPSGK